MAKRGELRPWRVRYQWEGQRDWSLGSYTSREAAEFARDQQAERIGPNEETCVAWVEYKDQGRA